MLSPNSFFLLLLSFKILITFNPRLCFSSEFYDYITQTISIGNRMFANDARRFLYSANKEYCQLLNFDDDAVFLESLILSYFLNEKKDTTLAQTFFKHLPTQSEKEF